ncbi:hypothetical protein CCP1ISM_330003 [Azospirillaceae bacterium]
MARRPDEEKLITSLPRIGLLLFPFVHHFNSLTEANLMQVKRVDATSSVKSFTYQKNKSQAAGTFSIVLTSDQNWTQIVRPGDWLLLYESAFGIGIRGRGTGKDSTKGLRCLGNIDRVSRQKTITQDGKKMFTYRIDGSDFGKVFEKIKFYYNPFQPKAVSNIFATLKGGIKITGSPASFVKSYVNLYLGDGTIKDEALKGDQILKKLEELEQLKIPSEIMEIFGNKTNSGRLFDILEMDIPEGSDNLTPTGYSWAIPNDRALNGSLWDILKSVSNNTMNELFLSMKYYPDKQMVKPTLTFRKQPWSKKNFHTLSRIFIQENMIITDDMGFDDHERLNWLNLEPKNSLIAVYPQIMAASQAKTTDKQTKQEIPLFPWMNKLSLKRYGFQERTFNSEFVNITNIDIKEGVGVTDLQVAEKWMRELIEWWENYERYESGTILVKGFSEQNFYESEKNGSLRLNNKLTRKKAAKIVSSDQYNIGENIYLNSRDRLYQLEGFSLEWNAPGESHVTFIVTRGVHWKKSMSEYKFVDETLKDKKGKVTTQGDRETQVELAVSVIKRK